MADRNKEIISIADKYKLPLPKALADGESRRLAFSLVSVVDPSSGSFLGDDWLCDLPVCGKGNVKAELT